MVIDGLQTSLSGIKSAVRRADRAAHNLANLSTPGFTPSRDDLADLAGGGVAVVGSTFLPAGSLTPTQRPLDLAIDGGGFFVVKDDQGQELYTRAGNFSLDAQGQVVDAMGRTVAPGVVVPPGAAQVEISPDGVVRALDPDGAVLAQGQLETAVFANPGGLAAVGGNAFAATAASGPAVVDAPGSPGHGTIVSGALQASGVDIVTETINQLTAQRALEANVKAAQTSDDITGTIIDLVG